ncbi:MAG: RdgB/HAM1 family non-canonical purine NTP pyrophosphatase [Alphaproteobacteria bacterium]|nr:RdgB/HAM1 family non-canonical purine NTP pyrophosphatase [Alphaproteobacteria bacterium]
MTQDNAQPKDKTPRAFTGDELVVATHNKGKLKELRELFGDKIKTMQSAADFGLESPEETGTTFIENALIKAQYVAKETGKPALADDSGLCISALGGDPGVYAADWAEKPDGTRDFYMAMEKVHAGMGDNPDKKAYFVSCLVLAWPDGHYEAVEGHAHGSITWPPRGDQGFGYDPIFVPEGDTRTYGEMASAEKEKTSHRAIAFEKMMAKCFP